MADEGGYAASWKKSKYEYVKGVMALRPPTLQWHPLKGSHADALRMAVDCITGAMQHLTLAGFERLSILHPAAPSRGRRVRRQGSDESERHATPVRRP